MHTIHVKFGTLRKLFAPSVLQIRRLLCLLLLYFCEFVAVFLFCAFVIY